MKLFYSPHTCALAVHIAALEAGLEPELVKLERSAQGMTLPGGDFAKLNPMKKVPTLEVDGEVMTEAQVLLQYLSSRAPEKLPFPGMENPKEHWRMLQLLNFIATDLHKGFSPLFHPEVSPGHRAALVATLQKAFKIVEEKLSHQPYLFGDRLTVADIYAWTVIGWTKRLGIDVQAYPHLLAWRKRMTERPAVQKALKDEGLPGTDPAL